MTQQTINVGLLPNDNTGDPIRTAFEKVNANFDEVYLALGLATGLAHSLLTSLDADDHLQYLNTQRAGLLYSLLGHSHAELAPVEHTHPISNVTGLTAALADKAAASHAQPISSIIGLSDTLAQVGFTLASAKPTLETSPGTPNQVWVEAPYFYLCYASNTWARIPLAW